MAELEKVIIADDHPLFRTALVDTIRKLHPDCEMVEAHDIQSLQEVVEGNSDCDLILLDLHMPGAHGFSGLIHLAARHAEIPVIIISAHESADIIKRAMDHGAAAYLPKSSSVDSIRAALAAVQAGDRWVPANINLNAETSNSEELQLATVLSTLTPKQFRVATMLSEGLLNKQIAYELSITEATVKAHVTEIFKKLGVQSRTQAVLRLSQLDVQAPQQEQP